MADSLQHFSEPYALWTWSDVMRELADADMEMVLQMGEYAGRDRGCQRVGEAGNMEGTDASGTLLTLQEEPIA